MPIGRWLPLVALGVLSACESGRVLEHDSPAAAAAAKAVVAKVAPPATRTAAPSPATENPKPAGEAVEWPGNVVWHTWSEALPIAAKESKPILVLVYADWCPHCRALGPVFADPEIEALAKHFVMVRQNNDEDPAWLEPYNRKFGGYVPRIFFFDSKGNLRENVTSGHPRYPYFYAAEAPEFLKKSMRQAIGS